MQISRCERGESNPCRFPHGILSLAVLLGKIRFLATCRKTVQEKARFREVFLGLKVGQDLVQDGREGSLFFLRMPVE